MLRPLPPGLVALSPGDLATPEDCWRFEVAAGEAFSAGLPALVLREPLLGDRIFHELAQRLCALRDSGEEGWLCVHDRVHIALSCGADAVHLGFRSLPPDTARGLCPEGYTVGFSAHAGDEAARLRPADYLFYGPVLPTPSKTGLVEPVGFEGLAEAVVRLQRPIYALGGMLPEHVAAAVDAGARGVAALSGVFGARRPGAAVREYLAALEAAGCGGA